MADHACLLIKVPDAVEVRELPPRKIWHFSAANWPQMKDLASKQSWTFLQSGSVDEMINRFNAFLLDMMEKHVPFSWKSKVKGSLPWLNNVCVAAIATKHAAEGTADYASKATRCQEILRGEYHEHMVKVKADMEKLPRGSKQWWSLAKTIVTKEMLIPPFSSFEDCFRLMVQGSSEQGKCFCRLLESQKSITR